MNVLIYESSETFMLEMVKKLLAENNIPHTVSSGDLGGVHGGLGLTNPTMIFTNESFAQKAKDLISSLGLNKNND